MNDSLLEVKNLDVKYSTMSGSVAACRNISFNLCKNESLGIIGESGSGKSTMAYALLDYLPSNAERSGEVLFKDENLLEKSSKELQKYRGDRLAMVYQYPYSALNQSLTIGRQLDEVTILHRDYSKKKAREASIAILKDLYLGDAAGIVKRYPHQISGGMQQRICIAMALLCRPDVIIMDEPTTALDVTTEATILDLVKDLRERFDMSIIYISHDIGVINKVSDRIAVMYRGEIVEIGAKKIIYNKPEHPYTRALINCMPRKGIVKEEWQLNTIKGYIRSRSAEEQGCPFAERCPKRIPGCEDDYGICDLSDGHYSACSRAYADDVPNDELMQKPSLYDEGMSLRKEREIPLLEIADVHKSFRSPRGRVRAVDGVSLTLMKDKVLGIVGESGCGKSTLSHMISGLTLPSSGRLLFDGVDISMSWRKRSKEILRNIQLVFQNPGRSLNPSFTVEQTLTRPMKRLLGIGSKEERQKRAVEILRKVDLGREYLTRKTNRLSGGERQRVAVARAFSITPNLIICDEPTSALDVSVQASVLNLLVNLQNESEVSYLFISHDLNVINYVSDYIMVMYLGRICEFGKRDEVTGPPYHPYTEALLSSVPEVDPSLSKEVIRLEGSPPNPTKKIQGCPFAERCPRKVGDICHTKAPRKQQFSENHVLYCHRDFPS